MFYQKLISTISKSYQGIIHSKTKSKLETFLQLFRNQQSLVPRTGLVSENFSKLSNNYYKQFFKLRTKPKLKDSSWKWKSSFLFVPFKLRRNKSFYFLLSAAGLFSWEENGIKDNEVDELVGEVSMLELGEHLDEPCLPKLEDRKELPDNWESIFDSPDIQMWKVTDKTTGEVVYKVLGRNNMVSASDFFAVQKNIEYRKVWDKLVISIDVVDDNNNVKSESVVEQVLRWITAFPYPFSPREYVYVRRCQVLEEDNIFAIFSRSVKHPSCEIKSKPVRVIIYVSHMLIRPHNTDHPELPGMDFLLTYSDDPRTVISSNLTSWLTTKGIPDYISKAYKASEELSKKKQIENSQDTENVTNTANNSIPVEVS